MSIRIGIYDFFAYTIPGIFYLFILGFWLNISGLVAIDLKTLNNLSLSSLIVLFGASYIVGLLIDPLAYNWMRVFLSRNIDVTKCVFKEFRDRHSWVVLDYDYTDWGILLRAIKSDSLEAATDVEQHNVAAIMLRNISLGLTLSSVSFLLYFSFFCAHIWNLIFCVMLFVLAIVAMRECRKRRRWFYIAIFEAFTAHFLLKENLGKKKKRKKPNIEMSKVSNKIDNGEPS